CTPDMRQPRTVPRRSDAMLERAPAEKTPLCRCPAEPRLAQSLDRTARPRRAAKAIRLHPRPASEHEGAGADAARVVAPAAPEARRRERSRPRSPRRLRVGANGALLARGRSWAARSGSIGRARRAKGLVPPRFGPHLRSEGPLARAAESCRRFCAARYRAPSAEIPPDRWASSRRSELRSGYFEPNPPLPRAEAGDERTSGAPRGAWDPRGGRHSGFESRTRGLPWGMTSPSPASRPGPLV